MRCTIGNDTVELSAEDFAILFAKGIAKPIGVGVPKPVFDWRSQIKAAPKTKPSLMSHHAMIELADAVKALKANVKGLNNTQLAKILANQTFGGKKYALQTVRCAIGQI